MINPLRLLGGNLGLKLLALALAIFIYHVLKTESIQKSGDDRPILQPR
jgi:hypothetical protein